MCSYSHSSLFPMLCARELKTHGWLIAIFSETEWDSAEELDVATFPRADGNGIGGYGTGAADAALGMLMVPTAEDFDNPLQTPGSAPGSAIESDV